MSLWIIVVGFGSFLVLVCTLFKHMRLLAISVRTFFVQQGKFLFLSVLSQMEQIPQILN